MKLQFFYKWGMSANGYQLCEGWAFVVRLLNTCTKGG
jgi:hypothetical protein